MHPINITRRLTPSGLLLASTLKGISEQQQQQQQNSGTTVTAMAPFPLCVTPSYHCFPNNEGARAQGQESSQPPCYLYIVGQVVH